jgi:hypothetical protein
MEGSINLEPSSKAEIKEKKKIVSEKFVSDFTNEYFFRQPLIKIAINLLGRIYP